MVDGRARRGVGQRRATSPIPWPPKGVELDNYLGTMLVITLLHERPHRRVGRLRARRDHALAGARRLRPHARSRPRLPQPPLVRRPPPRLRSGRLRLCGRCSFSMLAVAVLAVAGRCHRRVAVTARLLGSQVDGRRSSSWPGPSAGSGTSIVVRPGSWCSAPSGCSQTDRGPHDQHRQPSSTSPSPSWRSAVGHRLLDRRSTTGPARHLLWFLMVAALLAGLAVSCVGVNDRAPLVAADAPLERDRPRRRRRPLAEQLAASWRRRRRGLAVGAVGGRPPGDRRHCRCADRRRRAWLARSGGSTRAATPAKGRRLAERLVAPLGMPLGALAVIAFVVVIGLPGAAGRKRARLGGRGHRRRRAASCVVLACSPRRARLEPRRDHRRRRRRAASVSSPPAWRARPRASASSSATEVGPRRLHHRQEHQRSTRPSLTVPAGETLQSSSSTTTRPVPQRRPLHLTDPGGKPIFDGQPIPGVAKITTTSTSRRPARTRSGATSTPT